MDSGLEHESKQGVGGVDSGLVGLHLKSTTGEWFTISRNWLIPGGAVNRAQVSKNQDVENDTQS